MKNCHRCLSWVNTDVSDDAYQGSVPFTGQIRVQMLLWHLLDQ